MKRWMLLYWIACVIFSAVVISAFAQCTPPARSGRRVLKDIPYYTGHDADSKFQSLDLYLPEGKARMPLVIFVHGGGWRAGDKSMEGPDGFVELRMRQGVGLASIN